jgi:hypothetical protein
MVRVALAVNALISALVTVFAIQYLAALDGVAGGELGGIGDVQSAAHRLDVGNGITFLAWFVCGVLFIVWTHRTYGNLAPLGASGMRFRQGWAVAGWLVPVLAMWRPRQILGDAWRASDGALPASANRTEWGSRSVPRLLTAWWVLWIAGACAERLSLSLGDGTVDSARATLAVRVGGGVCLVAAALLAVWVVGALTGRQQARARVLGAADDMAGAAVAPGPAPERPATV